MSAQGEVTRQPSYVTAPETAAQRRARTVWLLGYGHALRGGAENPSPYLAGWARAEWVRGYRFGRAYRATMLPLPGLDDDGGAS